MRQPNLLFLMSDQQRGDTVQPGSPCRTPHLDALAARGTRFSRCYSPNPICSPTRASLFTGTLPHTHGMVDCTHTVEPYRAKFDADLPTWTGALKAAGYHTGYFGKWHVERSEKLERFGIDDYETKGGAYGQWRREQGLAGSAELSMACRVEQKGYKPNLLYGVHDEPSEQTAEHYWYQRGIDFIEPAAGGDAPWMCFVSTTGPHDPYVVPREQYERYDPASIPQPASFGDDLSDRPGIYRRCQSVWRDLDWLQFAEATACYYAYCSLIDDQVGRILAALERSGQAEDTLVVYTSDHGDYMGAHRLMLKGVPAFEEAYRVPLIVAGPDVAAGCDSDAVCSLMDLAPTLVESLTGGDFPCYGRSMRPLLAEEPGDWTNEAFAEMHGQRFFYTQRTLWHERYKYVFNGFDEDELYDLQADPHELNNLARDPGHQDIAEQMAARMWTIIRETGDHNMANAQYGMFRFAPVGPEAAG